MSSRKDVRKAKLRAGARLGFYIHLSVYAAVSVLCAIINIATSPGYFWFLWVVLGWGIGIAFHFLGVFVFTGSDSLNNRLVAEELDKIEGKRQQRS